MQYIPTDLPQYWKIHPRSDFSDALIQEDHVLIFSQDGQSLTVKKPDGTFEVLSGSNSGAVQMGVQAGVIVRQNGVLKFQPLSFDGTTASFSNSAQEYTSKIFNTTMEEPAYGGSSGTSMEFYKCSSVVDLQGEAIATCAKGSSYTGWTVSGSLSTEVVDDIPAIKLTGGSYLYRTVSSIPQGTSARTLSAWVRAAAYTSDWMGVFGYGTDTSMKRFSLDIGSTGIPNVGLSWDSVEASDSVVGSWHHLCAVYEAGTVKLYVDGTLASSAAKSLDTSGTTLYVGYGVGSATTYRGYIANCRAYARALSEAQITVLSREFTSGLSKTWSGRKAVLNNGVYSFQRDSTEGLTYTDIVPQVSKTYSADTLVQANLYTGIPTEGLKLYIPFDYGIYAKTGQTITQTNFPVSSGIFKGVPSTLFTGTCQLSVVPWANWLTNNDSFTIFIWVTYTYPSTAQSRAINAMQQTGGTELSIACWKQSRANAYLSNVAKGIYDFAADTWWWGCISHDASTNAVQITNSQGSTSGTVTLITSDNNLYIAGSANQGSNTRHQGRLAALRVYNRVLSSTQITALSQEFTPTA